MVQEHLMLQGEVFPPFHVAQSSIAGIALIDVINVIQNSSDLGCFALMSLACNGQA
jgi:hypothetical protein